MGNLLLLLLLRCEAGLLLLLLVASGWLLGPLGLALPPCDASAGLWKLGSRAQARPLAATAFRSCSSNNSSRSHKNRHCSQLQA
jgi:hypothetical protein